MGELTNIEWCDGTLNLWWGCTKVSNGCKNCYAEELSDKRYGNDAWGPGGTRKEVKSWRETLAKIAKRARKENRRLRVFCQSMSDTFEGPETMGMPDVDTMDAYRGIYKGEPHPNWVLVERLQRELFAAIVQYPELDFLLLTKRPENVMQVVHAIRQTTSDYEELYEMVYSWTAGLPPSNVWIGTSVEDQKTADERIPELLKIPAKVRFLSCEPLLGPVNLTCIRSQPYTRGEGEEWTNAFTGATSFEDDGGGGTYYSETGIDWVIVGGESGSKARPMHPSWARSLRDQCVAANVPFFFKQGSKANWTNFKDFASFPEDLQIREFPQGASDGYEVRSNA